MGGPRFYGPEMHHSGLGILAGLLGLLFIAALIGLLAWAIMSLANGHRGHPWARPTGPIGALSTLTPGSGAWSPPIDDALNAVRMRYAQGELDRETYFRLVEDLSGVPRPHNSWAPQEPPAAAAPPNPDPAPHPVA